MKKVTKTDLKKAEDVIRKFKKQKFNELKEIQENCKHEHSYRYWYDENSLFSVCKSCFREIEIKHRPFFLADYRELTDGYEPTNGDYEKRDKFLTQFK